MSCAVENLVFCFAGIELGCVISALIVVIMRWK